MQLLLRYAVTSTSVNFYQKKQLKFLMTKVFNDQCLLRLAKVFNDKKQLNSSAPSP